MFDRYVVIDENPKHKKGKVLSSVKSLDDLKGENFETDSLVRVYSPFPGTRGLVMIKHPDETSFNPA